MKSMKLDEDLKQIKHAHEVVSPVDEADELRTGGWVCKAKVDSQRYREEAYLAPITVNDFEGEIRKDQVRDHCRQVVMNMVYGEIHDAWFKAMPMLLYSKEPILHEFNESMKKFFAEED